MKQEPPRQLQEDAPPLHYEEIPGALDLGIYYSDNKDEFQVAKIAEQDRATHLYVVGATGTGKTKFLEFLIRQDIVSGNGIGVIDPHGDLVEDIKAFLAYRYHLFHDEAEVAEHVVLVDPTDPAYTVTFNPLEQMPGVSAAEQAGELVASFRKIWSDSWGVRMEDLMRNSLIALGEAEMTLCELPAFLTRRSFREAVVAKVGNPIARDYFRRFDTLTDRGQITWIEPVMNKINAFLADERMRQIFASNKSSFQLRDIMDSGKCLLVKLDKGKLKDSTDLIGSLLMAKIQLAAFSRSEVSRHKRKPFHLYIDEFQNFATESFKVILSEARKYALSLTMAHQTLSQIPDDLRGLILGSAGVQVCFRVNRQDAQLLAKEFFEYSGYEIKTMSGFHPKYWSYAEEWEHKTEELQHLPPRCCYAKHKIQGGTVALQTVEMESGSQMLGMSESEFLRLSAPVPFGKRYLCSRSDLAAEMRERLDLTEEAIQPSRPEAPPTPVPARPRPERPKDEVVASGEAKPPQAVREPEQRVEREHRRLQHLIKRLGESKGYRATIEQPTEDGQGRVDVALESEGVRIAFEVSITTSCEQELANIRKCLSSSFDLVVNCSSDKKTLSKVQALCEKKLDETERPRVLYLAPDDIPLFFEEIAAAKASKTDKIRGYKVNVSYQPVQDDEKKAKRETMARVILDSLRRKK